MYTILSILSYVKIMSAGLRKELKNENKDKLMCDKWCEAIF